MKTIFILQGMRDRVQLIFNGVSFKQILLKGSLKQIFNIHLEIFLVISSKYLIPVSHSVTVNEARWIIMNEWGCILGLMVCSCRRNSPWLPPEGFTVIFVAFRNQICAQASAGCGVIPCTGTEWEKVLYWF